MSLTNEEIEEEKVNAAVRYAIERMVDEGSYCMTKLGRQKLRHNILMDMGINAPN